MNTLNRQRKLGQCLLSKVHVNSSCLAKRMVPYQEEQFLVSLQHLEVLSNKVPGQKVGQQHLPYPGPRVLLLGMGTPHSRRALQMIKCWGLQHEGQCPCPFSLGGGGDLKAEIPIAGVQ